MFNQIDSPESPLPERYTSETLLSRWGRRIRLLTMVLGFAGLILFTVKVYREAPPIPDKVTGPDGSVLFSGDDIRDGQQLFLKYGLLDNGTIWSRGDKRSRDSSIEHQQTLALYGATSIAQRRYGQPPEQLTPAQRALVEAEVRAELKRNRYDPKTGVLAVGPAYGDWYRNQSKVWEERLSKSVKNGGTSARTIRDPDELKQLSAFVAWTEWASDANHPGTHSYAKLEP